MPRSRDRHDRGLRGPLARPNPWVSHPPRLTARHRQAEFNLAVQNAVALVMQYRPQALRGIRIAIADVPVVTKADFGVPLAESIIATPDMPAQLILYRRPLEHRAQTRRELSDLICVRLIEQLSALTGLSPFELTGFDFELD